MPFGEDGLVRLRTEAVLAQGDSHKKGAVMTITLEVPPHLEGPLRERLARDGDAARQLLDAAFASALEAMLAQTPPPLTDAEFEALADELADHLEASAGDAAARLSDEAITREGIYGDHP